MFRLKFYISFVSDGVEFFTEHKEENSLTVYNNPSFEQFERTVQKYDPNRANPIIRIKVEYNRFS